MKQPPACVSRPLIALALTLTVTSLPAQPARSNAASQEAAEQLPPFEVSSKRSPGVYVQEEVTSVTKFAVPIIDVPQNIFVFNRQFLEDLNVGALRDALAYNASMQGGVFSVGGSYRGFSNQQKLKDGFIMSPFFDYDPAHFERIEMLKGPSAVMYGRTEPGGITNYVTKRPILGTQFARFGFGLGRNNKNTRRNANFDINMNTSGLGAHPLALRLTAAHRLYEDSKDSQTDNGMQKQNSIRLAASQWVTNSTRVYASYMFYQRDFDTQFGRYASFAVGVPQTTPGHTIPFSILYGRDPFEDYGYGRKFYWQFNDTQVIVDHKAASNLDFRFAFNLHKRTNEDYLLNIAAATLAGQGAIRQIGVNKNKDDFFYPDLQLHAVWKPGPDHNVLAGYSRNWTFMDQKQWFNSRNPDGTPFSRTYIPSQGIPRSLPGDIFYLPTAHNRQTIDYQTLTLNYHGGFLQNRLHVMAGIAHNDTTTEFRRSALVPNPPPDFSTDDFNPQVGAIYKVTPEVSIFALASQSTQYTFTRDSFGNYFGPITGDGVEGGFKFAFLRNTLNGTLTYYTVDQSDNVVFDPLAESFSFRQSVQAGSPNPALRGDQVAGGTTQSKGVEFEINGAITTNWNVQFSYAYNKQTFKKNPNPVIQGTLVAAQQPHTVAVFTRYDFREGAARGLYLGAGVIHFNKSYGGFSPGSNNTRTYWADGATRLDFIAGYRFQAFGRENLLKFTALGFNGPKNFRAGFDPARNDVYYLESKPILQLDWAITF